MQVLKGIILSPTEPPSTDVLWIKPVQGGVALYIHDGTWMSLQIINDMGTATPDDDVVIDVKNIPSMENLEQKIEGEVTKQMATHDEEVRDTHNEPTGDSHDYPDVVIFG